MDGGKGRRLHLPMTAPEGVIPHLGRGELHWKVGYSAHALATSWFEADGLPGTVSAVLDQCEAFRGCTLLDGFFERETDLRDGLGRASQTDLLALVRTNDGPAVVAVEGKVEESFGVVIGDRSALSPGQQQRLAALCKLFEVDEAHVSLLRYQLFHRAAAAVFEADRYGFDKAMLLVHSFSAHQTGRPDYERFCDSLGLGGRGDVRGPIIVLGVELYTGWVADQTVSAQPAPREPMRVYGQGDGRVEDGELRRLLIEHAKRGRLITYGEVATAFGETWQQGFGSSLKRALNLLGDQNREAGEPLLMALVVNKDSREPGPGFYERIGQGGADASARARLLASEVERCRTWDW